MTSALSSASPTRTEPSGERDEAQAEVANWRRQLRQQADTSAELIAEVAELRAASERVEMFLDRADNECDSGLAEVLTDDIRDVMLPIPQPPHCPDPGGGQVDGREREQQSNCRGRDCNRDDCKSCRMMRQHYADQFGEAPPSETKLRCDGCSRHLPCRHCPPPSETAPAEPGEEYNDGS